jgi:hypothetical protein
MAAYTKFQQFTQDVCQGLHVLKTAAGNTLKLMLTNTAPNVADTIVDNSGATAICKATSNATELATGGGYTANGTTIGNPTTASQTSGTFTLAANQVQFVATTGFGPFRYVALFNDSTATSATRPPIAWWDYGAGGVTLAASETFTVKFNSANPGTIFTML